MPGLSLTIQQSTLAARTWALVPGVREVVLVALVAAALYGRSAPLRPAVAAARRLRGNRRSRPDRGGRHPAARWVVDRRWLVVALLAGAGLAAWLATSSQVVQSWAAR